MQLPLFAPFAIAAAFALPACSKRGEPPTALHMVPGGVSTATVRHVEIRFEADVAVRSTSVSTAGDGGSTLDATLTVDGKEVVVEGDELRVGDERYGPLSPTSLVVIGKAGVRIDGKMAAPR